MYDFSLGIIYPLFNFYTGFGCSITLLCGVIISPTFSPVVVPKYKELGRHKKAYWDTLLGSSLHAVISVMVALYALLFDQLSKEYISSQSAIGRSLIQFSLGYFLVDLTFCMLDSEMRKDIMNTLHHMLALFGLWLVVYHDGVAVYWVVFQLVTEFSTPFVNILWYLLFINYPKQSTLFITNSLLLVITFYTCRILTIPYHWIALYYLVYQDPSVTVVWPLALQYWIVMSYVMVDVLNVIWGYKIARGGYKSLKQLQKT